MLRVACILWQRRIRQLDLDQDSVRNPVASAMRFLVASYCASVCTQASARFQQSVLQLWALQQLADGSLVIAFQTGMRSVSHVIVILIQPGLASIRGVR